MPVGERNHNTQGRNKVQTRRSWTHCPTCVSQTVKPVPNLTLIPSLALTGASISRYELLSSRTNLHSRVEPIITDWFGRQHTGLHSCGSPIQKGLPRAPHAACTGPSRRGGGKGCTLPFGRLFCQNNTALLALAHCIPSPHMSLALEGFIA